VRSFDYKYRKFGSTHRPGWTPSWSTSLKGMLEQITGVPPEKQRLMFRGSPMNTDELSIKSYQVNENEYVTFKVRQPITAPDDRQVELACTKKRQRYENVSDDEVSIRTAVRALRDKRELTRATSDSQVRLMPRSLPRRSRAWRGTAQHSTASHSMTSYEAVWRSLYDTMLQRSVS